MAFKVSVGSFRNEREEDSYLKYSAITSGGSDLGPRPHSRDITPDSYRISKFTIVNSLLLDDVGRLQTDWLTCLRIHKVESFEREHF